MTDSTHWERDFAGRMRQFALRHPSKTGEFPVSIKFRVTSGCFHREHSPDAYKTIDERLNQLPKDVGWDEHESGPEILLWVSAGVALGTSVIGLIDTIIKARAREVRGGSSKPSELIVRRIDDGQKVIEECILRIGPRDKIDKKFLQKQIDETLTKLRGR